MRQIGIALGLAISAPALAQGPGPISAAQTSQGTEWRKIDPSVRKIEDLASLERLAREIPWSRNIRLALMNGYLEADRKDDAYAEVVRLVEAGHAFSANGQRALLGLFDGVEHARLAELFAVQRPPVVASEVAAEVPSDILLVEAAALDERTGRMFAGSIVSQGLFAKEPGARLWSRVPLEHTGSIGGMLIDEERHVLWAASAIYDETPHPEGAFSGLIGLPLDGGPEKRIAFPDGAVPSDIMLASDGSLYAADPVNGAIYRTKPGATAVSLLVAPGTFRSPQGMVEAGGNILVSDWGYGLALVDNASGRIWRVDPEMSVMLDGIDSMWRYGEWIVAVQNGARPAQIVAFRLSPDCRRIVEWRVIERDVPGWSEPGSGSLAGDRLLYVGNGQWGSFAGRGALREGAEPEPTTIRRLDLADRLAIQPKNPG